MKPESAMIKKIKNLVDRKLTNPKAVTEFCDRCYLEFNLPQSKVNDIINERSPYEKEKRFVLYCLLKTCSLLYKEPTEKEIKEYLSPGEVKKFAVQRYIPPEEYIKLPFVFDMVQVDEDQWIGSIDVATLMGLVRQQILRYNADTQRPLRAITHNGESYYVISNNTKAIQAIADCLRQGIFVPNTITLNILDTDPLADFYYDKEGKRLIINNVTYLDILDGWHRIKAYQHVFDENPEWKYSLELRITNFGIEKSHQFIYQEDQKTKMTKYESDSFNINNYGSIIADKINKMRSCSVSGCIGRADDIINLSWLAPAINAFFVGSRKLKQFEIAKITNDIAEDFNILVEANPEKYLKKYTFKQLTAAVYVFSKFQESLDKGNLPEIVEKMTHEVEKIKAISPNILGKKAVINNLNTIWEDITNV